MSDPLQKAFADNVRRLRQAQKISQEEFAARCLLGRAYYGRVERGLINVSLNTMARIADGLGATIADLVADIEKANISTKRVFKITPEEAKESYEYRLNMVHYDET